jgi:hypothetical protein
VKLKKHAWYGNITISKKNPSSHKDLAPIPVRGWNFFVRSYALTYLLEHYVSTIVLLVLVPMYVPSEGAPCPLLPSNGAIWGIFVAKWDIMSDNSFKVPTFTYLFLLKENNSPNFPNSHHLPMSLRENSIGYVLLYTKILIFLSSSFLLYFRIVEFYIYLQIIFLHCLHFVIISYYLTSTPK